MVEALKLLQSSNGTVPFACSEAVPNCHCNVAIAGMSVNATV